MSGNDWNNLGRDVKDIVQHAIDTGDFGALNRDLGVTLESALGNVAQSMKNAAKNGMGRQMNGNPFGNGQPAGGGPAPNPYGGGTYRPYGNYRRPETSRRYKEAREEFALFVNTGSARALGILFTVLGITLTAMFGISAVVFGITSLFVATVAEKIGIIMGIFLPATGLSVVLGICGSRLRNRTKPFH